MAFRSYTDIWLLGKDMVVACWVTCRASPTYGPLPIPNPPPAFAVLTPHGPTPPRRLQLDTSTTGVLGWVC